MNHSFVLLPHKSVLILLCGLLLSSSIYAQNWVRTMGNSGQQVGEAIAIDASGNNYTTGSFQGTVDFDPSAAIFELTAQSSDIFVVKLDINGDFVWAKKMGGTNGDEGTSIKLDASGNIYVSGGFNGTADFDPSATTFNLTSAGQRDFFIAKLDANGNLVWAKRVGGTSTDNCGAIALDGTGNIYATGYFNLTVDFNPGTGTFNLTSSGSADIFLLKLDNNGNFVWANRMGSTEGDFASDITVGASGNPHITGSYRTTVDFDPSAGIANLTSMGEGDIYIAKYTVAGAFVWAKSIGSTSYDDGNSLTTDALENVYVAGDFSATADFDPGLGVFNLVPEESGSNGFVIKLNSTGNFSWASQFSGPFGSTNGYSIALDATMNSYVIGSAFDGDDGSLIIMVKLDASGNLVVNDTANGSGSGSELAVDAVGTVYATGRFEGTVDFTLLDCLGSLSGGTSDDIFILKTSASGSATITSFTPTTATLGSTVVITGTGFSTTPSDNGVYFGGEPAIVTASTTTTITTSVPVDAVTGRISVSVGCGSALSITDFIVDCGSAPTITSFSPSSGVVGTTVTIIGTNFSTTPSDNIVDFGGYSSVVTASTSTSITTSVPAGPIGLVPITLTIACNSVTSPTDFDVTCPPAPTITSFSPATGAVGDLVTITGTNFSTNPSDNYVDFNGEPAIVTASTATSITTSVPTNTFTGPINVYVGCDVVSTSTDFIVDCGPAPIITSFSPANGLAGTTIIISGTNFSTTPANNFVDFNGELAVVSASSATSITTTVPAGAITGPITIVVDCNYVTSTTDFIVGTNINITTQPSDFITCVGQTATFSTAATGTTNISYQWQFSVDGIVFTDITNGGGYSNATTPTLTVNTTGNFGSGRYRCRINGDFASEVISNDEGLFINSIPTAPTVVDASRCGIGSVTLTASGGSNGQYKWYTVASGGTAIAGEVNGTYTTPSLSSTTNYFVSLTVNSCESIRASATATINTLPTSPTATGASACLPSASVTLNASGGTNGQYRWYTISSGGTAIVGQTNSSFITPILSATTTYFVSINNGTCESGRTSVVASLIPCTTPPTIVAAPLTTSIGGIAELNLVPLISTVNNPLNISSITVIVQPPSGAIASILNGKLLVDYGGISFSGIEQVTLRACDTNGNCATQVFEIEVAGDVIVFNALSPNGANPSFIIQYIEIIPETKNNTVTIFDRWQNEVWKKNNYNNNSVVFEGISDSGNDLPTGIYFYKIEFISGRKMQTGFISLKR